MPCREPKLTTSTLRLGTELARLVELLEVVSLPEPAPRGVGRGRHPVPREDEQAVRPQHLVAEEVRIVGGAEHLVSR